MNKLSRTTRLLSAAIAAATTLVIFGSVVSIAEPQRSELLAKNQRIEKTPFRTTTLALVSDHSTMARK